MNTNNFPKEVSIFEVGPRDGLQNEPVFIPTEKKIEYVNMLAEAGCKRIEVTSFVNPKWVPQLKDAKEVIAGMNKKEGVTYNALIPNMRGLEFAIEAGLKEVVTIISSSESHNKKNLNMCIADSLEQIKEINRVAAENGVKVRSYIATVFGCPIEGDVPLEKVEEIALALESYGSYEISLGDTTGMANPISAYEIPKYIKSKLTKADLAVHYHRAKGLEFANILASLEAGITIIDGAAGGMGGCPYAPGSTGNTETERLVDLLHRMNIQTGIDLEKITACGTFIKVFDTSACHV